MPATKSVNREEKELRLRATAEAMIRLRSSHRVEVAMAKRFTVNPRTVRRWISQVREIWQKQAKVVDVDAHRNDVDQLLNEVVFQAINRTVVVKNDDGTVVVDQDPKSPTFGKPIVKPQPDLQRVLHATAQLRAIHGTDRPTQSKVSLSPDLEEMPDFSKMTTDQVKATEAWLSALAPDGNIALLAGQFFEEATPMPSNAKPTAEPTEDK